MTGSTLDASTYDDFKRRLTASGCSLCPALCAERHSIVVDRGNPSAGIVVVGEAPGATEDAQGQAFVGRAGRLLDRIFMEAAGWDTNRDVLIVNVVKCRPPDNRPPTPAEAANCRPYLEWQLRAVRPRAVLLLGATAARHLLPVPDKRPLRDRVGRAEASPAFPGIPFFLLYHPAFLLRDPRRIPETKSHLQAVQARLAAPSGVR